MFFPSRVIAIDDNEQHLGGIKAALHSLRLDCHSVHYDEQTGVNDLQFPGMRVLFLDLHLISGAGVGTAANSHFAVLAGVLDSIVDIASGPYILILWTQYPEELAGLNTYLDGLSNASLDKRKLPVATYSLRKGDFINVANGEPVAGTDLKSAISDRLSQNPQMKALFGWEADVLAAMDATLRSIVDLVPESERTTGAFGPSLGKVLFRISQAGAGQSRAMDNPRESINRVLVPVLADRISEHDPEGQATANWKQAIVTDTGNLPSLAKARLNTSIHISTAIAPGSAPIAPTDLGAVISYPFGNVEKSLKERFDLTPEDLRGKQFFDLQDIDQWAECNLCLVQVGASCDHAQPKKGPVIYLLGIEWPFTSEAGKKNLSPVRKPPTDREWNSPAYLVGNNARPGRMSVFLNCSTSVRRESKKRWTVKYRFRDELISQLTQEYARHISRPGIVSL